MLPIISQGVQALLDLLSALEGSVSEVAKLLGYNSPLDTIKIQKSVSCQMSLLFAKLLIICIYESGHALIEFAMILKIPNL